MSSSAGDTRRSRDVAGCYIFKEYSEISPKGSLGAISSYFIKACNSSKFITDCTHAGFSNCSFHSNEDLLQPGNPCHDKFAEALKDLDRKVCLGVAFHGTAGHNIPFILRDGLDHQKRKGQAYGPGEYFGKDPAISVGYCKDGLRMIVFVVVLPSTLPADTTTTTTTITDSRKSGRRSSAAPEDYLVVKNNAHQLPIGTLKFTSVNQQVLKLSQEKRKTFLRLSREALLLNDICKEKRVKERIIRDLMDGLFDVASERYKRELEVLEDTSKKEIAWYVQTHVDEAIIPFLFPDLPDSMKLNELAKAKIQSNDDAERELCEAMQKLENERPGTTSSRAIRKYDSALFALPFTGNLH